MSHIDRENLRRLEEVRVDKATAYALNHFKQSKTMMKAALEYAQRGWRIFPCSVDKKPLIKDWPNKASKDSEQIKEWWSDNPSASIGLPTGHENGVWVLDVDLKSGGFESLAKLEQEHGSLPQTLKQQTGGGGIQCIWKWNGQEIRNSAGKIAPGIDVRGAGGYVILPPSGHPSGEYYKWENNLEPMEPPVWLMDLVREKKNPEPKDIGRVKDTSSTYGEAALARELVRLSSATPGSRNQTLNECAFALGQLIAGGELNGLQAETALYSAAVSIGLAENEARKTIRSGVSAGERQPRFADREEMPYIQNLSDEPDEDDEHEAEASHLRFPEEVMSGAACEFTETMTKYMEPSSQFFFMAYLTCLGAVASGRVMLNTALLKEPRLYVLLLGESADDRKSTSISKTISFFTSTLGKFGESFGVCHGIGSAEGLQKQLVENPRLLLCFDEFRSFTSKCKIESSVLMPAVSTLFEEKIYESHTKSKSISIDHASLSMIAASTIATYENLFDEHFLALGFPNRLFLVPGKSKRKFAIPRQISDGEWNQMVVSLKAVVDNIKEIAREDHGLILISPEARKHYSQWYIALPQSLHAKRLDAYALRIMTLLALNDLKPHVDLETVDKSIKLMDWQLLVRQEYDPIDADSKMAVMEEKIRRTLRKGPKTERNIRKAVHSERSGEWLFKNAFKNLREAGQVRMHKKKYHLVGDPIVAPTTINGLTN